MSSEGRQEDTQQKYLLFLTVILFIAYLCVGLTLPVVPVFVAHNLGLNNVWAGLTVGIAFFSTIVTRGYAGRFVDIKGSKPSVRCGLILYMTGALLCLMSGLCSTIPALSLVILMSGRIILGLGESFVGVGINTWGIALVGLQRSGKVMALVGAAIYGAIGIGGPLGLILYHDIGYSCTMLVSFILPAFGLVAITKIPFTPPPPMARKPSFLRLLGKIWLHGSIICLQGIGFAAIGAFFALYFSENHWPGAGLGLATFGGGYVLIRFFCGGLPDRIGGLRITLCSLLIEAVGQLLIWAGHGPVIALTGAFLSGVGCSMIYPGIGREVMNLVTPQERGIALGGFSAFQDLSYGLTGPLAGLIADLSGYRDIFLASCFAAMIAFFTTLFLYLKSARTGP